MNFSNLNSPLSKLRTRHYICCVLTFLLFSCAKEVIIVPPDTNATEVVILSPESNTSNNLIFSAEVRYLNNSDSIQSHGFIVDGISGETYIKKEYSISTPLKAGRITFKVPDSEIYKEGTYFLYKYFINTKKGMYTSKLNQFVVSNLKVQAKDNLIMAIGETVTVDGEFTKIEKNYDLVYSYYTYEEFKIPFEIINAGKSIRFQIPEGLEQGNNVTFRLVSKDQKGPQLAAIVANAFIVAKLSLPSTYSYYFNDVVNLPYTTKNYYDNNGLQVFIGNVFLKHSEYLRISDFILHQKGKSFPMGYTNGRDTVTFPQPLNLIEPDPNDFIVKPDYVHPGTTFEVSGPDPAKFNFYGYVTVGDKRAYYLQEGSASKKEELSIGDLPDGEYPMEMTNYHFSYKSNNKIKVRKVNISSISPSASYTGDIITLKGLFIKGRSYTLEIDKTSAAYSSCTTNGEITFEIPLMKAGNYQVKVQHFSEIGSTRPSNTVSLEIKRTIINSIYPLRAKSGSLITIEGNGMNGYKAQIADVEVRHTLSQNNKIQFKIPDDLPKGKYRINISDTAFDFDNTVSATEYLEIY
jgi:hypothetical protein